MGNSLGSWIGRINVVEKSVFLKMIYRFNVIPIKILASYFTDFDTLILKFIWRGKSPKVANKMLKN